MSGVIGKAIPIFRVTDLVSSLAYYTDTLGFRQDWGHEASFASVSREGCTLFLCVGDQGNPPAWAWVGVPDAEALHDEFRSKGASIRQAPTNFSWALEIQVQDPDGNVLRFGSEPRPDVPFGPWLDMNGKLWTVSAEGDGT